MSSPKKNKTVQVRTANGSYDFSYATLDAVIDSIRRPLSENGIAWLQYINEGQIVTLLKHSSGGELLSSVPILIPEGSTPQQVGSILTYYRRYSLCLALGIAADDDDDANVAEGNAMKEKRVNGRPKSTQGPPPDPESLRKESLLKSLKRMLPQGAPEELVKMANAFRETEAVERMSDLSNDKLTELTQKLSTKIQEMKAQGVPS
jgi:hypothetical protein